MVHMFSEIVV